MKGQIYGCEKQQIENLNWAMEQLEADSETPIVFDDIEQRHLKTWKLGEAILFLMDERAKYYKPAKESWNESCNGHEYNIKVEVARID